MFIYLLTAESLGFNLSCIGGTEQVINALSPTSARDPALLFLAIFRSRVYPGKEKLSSVFAVKGRGLRGCASTSHSLTGRTGGEKTWN